MGRKNCDSRSSIWHKKVTLRRRQSTGKWLEILSLACCPGYLTAPFVPIVSVILFYLHYCVTMRAGTTHLECRRIFKINTHYHHATPSIRAKKICLGYPESLTSVDRLKLKVCAARVCHAPAQAVTENMYRQGWAGWGLICCWWMLSICWRKKKMMQWPLHT